MLNGSKLWLVGAAVVAAIAVSVVAIYSLNREQPLPLAASNAETGVAMLNTSERDSANSPDILSEQAPQASSQSNPEASIAKVAEDAGNDAAFRVTAAGELVLDEQTRLNIEALVADSERRELYAEVREQTESLPPAAARVAEELVNKFVTYQQAQRQSYPPDDAPSTAEDAVQQLEGLHALREAHFGPDVARRLYGKEELIAREMIEVMRVENDASLTTQEKLERARALRDQLPGVAAIEKNNRDTAAAQNPHEEK